LLQVSTNRKGKSKLILRDLSGAVLTQIHAGALRAFSSVSCTGRHVVAVQLGKNGPAISEYDL
jgi:hypothetical protein